MKFDSLSDMIAWQNGINQGALVTEDVLAGLPSELGYKVKRVDIESPHPGHVVVIVKRQWWNKLWRNKSRREEMRQRMTQEIAARKAAGIMIDVTIM